MRRAKAARKPAATRRVKTHRRRKQTEGAGLHSPPFPAEDDALVVAEWVELSALASKSGQMSLGSLQMACARSDIVSKSMAEDAWSELERRAELCGARWPFAIDNARVRVRTARTPRAGLYTFMAALAMRSEVTREHRTLFEICVAELVGGITARSGMAIGFKRRPPVPGDLNSAIALYCEASHEKSAFLKRFPPTDKDLDVDVVAWRSFEDERGAYHHFVGQCATGADWREKLTELNPHKWGEHVHWAVPPTRFFATPTIVRKEEIRRLSMDGGLMLDRPRLLELEERWPLKGVLRMELQKQCRQFYSDS